MIVSHRYAATEPGPRLLITGAVHGNEKCGTVAIRRIMQEIDRGDLILLNGAVTFVPICNPRAYDADRRFTERNLNRFLIPQDKPDCYEAKLGNILCPMLAACDVLLDLHSYTAGGTPFVFVGEGDAKEDAFAQCLGAAALLTGWQDAYAASGREQAAADPNEPVGTTEYARRFGATAVTLECGQHRAPQSAEVAYHAVRRALAYLKMTAPLPVEAEAPTPLIKVKKVFYRESGGTFTKPWKHLEKVKKGDVIAKNDVGLSLVIPEDGVLILPHADTLPGTEWFYWGQEVGS